eukprot:GHUV01018467.1.p1 GENE.GHUV01018467.1~~GHUV01018467.1.p1  ORF type:complete len:767 (+),score=339.43 GHUV01018467.1:108-2408(+)
MFSGFLNRERGKSGGAKLGQGGQVFSSNAAAALAASVASAPDREAPPETPRHKGRTLEGDDVQVDLDELRPGEAVAELQVQPITLIKNELKLEHTQQVAISNSYICYGLKAGHIRTLNRNTATRALFKGHPASLSYIAFFNADTNLLASASREGDITVRLVTDAAGPEGEIVPADTVLMLGQLPVQQVDASPAPPVTLAWHPSISQILAAGAAGTVSIFEVPTGAPAQQPPALSEPGIKYSLPSNAAVTAVAFSPRGDLLFAGDSAGYVHAWWMEGEEDLASPLLTWQPFNSSAAVASVQVLHQADDGSSLLLTGNAANTTLKLWMLQAAGPAADMQPTCLQTIRLTSQKGPHDNFCHVVVQPQLQLVVLANTVRKQVYTLHYVVSAAAGPAAAHFDYLAQFSVKQPMLSLTTGLEAVESQEVPGEVQPQQLLLYTVQTDAVQQYVIDPALCSIPAATRTQAALGETAEASSSTAVPPAVDSGDTSAATAAEPSAATAVSATGESAAGESVQDSTAESVQTAAAVESEPVTAESSGPVAAAVPPPTQLPTPGLLLHSRSEAAAAAAAAKAQDAAVAPPPQAVAEAAGDEASAEALADAAAERQLEPPVLDEPAVAVRSTADGTAPEPAVVPEHPSAEPVAALHDRPATPDAAPLPPMPTSTLIHSAEKSAAAASPPVTPPSGPAEDAAADDAASKAPPAAAATADGMALKPAAAASAARIASADVAALQHQMQQLLVMQQQLAAQLQASSQQTVAGELDAVLNLCM